MVALDGERRGLGAGPSGHQPGALTREEFLREEGARGSCPVQPLPGPPCLLGGWEQVWQLHLQEEGAPLKSQH